MLSKSLHNPSVIKAMRTHYQTANVTALGEEPMSNRNRLSPLVKSEIAGVINQNDALKKLYLR
jgi:hypothetical protein